MTEVGIHDHHEIPLAAFQAFQDGPGEAAVLLADHESHPVEGQRLDRCLDTVPAVIVHQQQFEIETGGLAALFRADLRGRLVESSGPVEEFPVFATTVVAITVIGFGVGSSLGLAPVWVATAGAAVLSVHRLVARRTTIVRVFRSTAPSFCLFVLGLAIVVRAVSDDGLGRVVRHLVPSGAGFLALLGVAAVAAVLSNLINNLPATLLLLPIAAVGGVGPALAVLIGVNIGPNLTYPGSLATLLWRRSVAGVAGVPTVADFTRLGIATVPAAVVAATAALWLSLRVIGTA